MSCSLAGVRPAQRKRKSGGSGRSSRTADIPRRTARYEDEPGYHEPSGLWFYGNIRLLHASLVHIPHALGAIDVRPSVLDDIEREAETHVLQSRVLVCGFHNVAHMRSAIVPLRWGSPRIVVMSGGFKYHLGDDLLREPFLSATLWRERWDSRVDLAVSRRAPNKLPTFARHNATVDRLIMRLARGEMPGICSPYDTLTPFLQPA